MQAWRPEVSLQNSQRGGRRKPLTSTLVHCTQAHECMHILIITIMLETIRDKEPPCQFSLCVGAPWSCLPFPPPQVQHNGGHFCLAATTLPERPVQPQKSMEKVYENFHSDQRFLSLLQAIKNTPVAKGARQMAGVFLRNLLLSKFDEPYSTLLSDAQIYRCE